MLSRTIFKSNRLFNANAMKYNMLRTPARVFSSDVGFGDVGDVLKVDYTEEFDQGLSDE
jgi:hypothetical protein